MNSLFAIPSNTLPVPLVALLPDPTGFTEEEAEAAVSAWETNIRDNSKQNDTHLHNARHRMGLCSFLRGFLHYSDAHLYPHYSWCPGEQWEAFLGIDRNELKV